MKGIQAVIATRAVVVWSVLCACLGAAEANYCRPPKQGGVYVIAHRGAHRDIPENTLPAYQEAIELGADFVEIDLRTTKDGQLVSIHDDTVDGYVVDGTLGRVRDFSLSELRALDIGARVGPSWKGQRVPTLDEILKLCKDKIGIYLDLKDGSIQAVAGRIEHYGMQQQVVWCIDPDQVAALRSACPDCIAMPDPESEETLLEMLTRTKPSIVAPVWSDFSATFAAKCQDAGAIVFVDERESTRANWQQALDWGADGIQTDDPKRLIAFLREQEERQKGKEAVATAGTVLTSKLTAGTARVDVTPPAEMKATLGGYGERMSRPAEGIHDRVFVKALVISDLVRNRRFALLTADILAFPPAFKPALMKRLAGEAWTSDQVMLLASHSHTSIDLNAINPANTLGNKQMGIFDERLYEWTLERCELAIRQAAHEQVDVVIGTASKEIIGWNRNRRQRDGLTDNSLTVTRIDQTDGRPLAALVNFTAHPTFMSAKHMFFSGGWPGHLQRSLERAIGDAVNVLYYNGAEGDQSPVGRPGSGINRWKAAEQYGHELSQHAHQLWMKVKTKRDVAFGYHSETIELPEKRWHPDFMRTGGDEYGLSEELLQKILPVMFPSQTTSGCFQLGDLLIIGVPGEMAAGLGLRIKEEAANFSGTRHVTVGGLADAWVSYILSPEEYDRGGYEASVSFYGRNLGPRVVAGATASVRAMHLRKDGKLAE